MNIFRYINSKDIRGYLEKIGYEFSSLEAAWLIYQCRSVSLKGKHAAWRELIQTMPDCPIERRPNTDPHDSLHRFLEEYMEMEDRWLKTFIMKEENAIFQLEEQEQNTWVEEKTLSSSYWKCFEKIKEYKKYIADGDATNFFVWKKYLDGESYNYRATVSADGQILSINQFGFQNDYELSLSLYSFDGLWFAFPTPFQKGDILWEPNTEGFCKGPFVMTRITSRDDYRAHGRDGDNSDMNAWGYFQCENGDIYGESMWNYMGLEYYRGELAGKRRILKALSNFLKDKIDVGLLLKAYHEIMSDEYAKDMMPCFFTKEGMILAGLIEQEHVKIWLDDIREAPAGYLHCKSVNAAKEQIIHCEKECVAIDVIDCDHDLGEYAQDGGDGIKLIDWLVERKTYYPLRLHTANPVGRENMQREIDRYWK